MDVTDAPARHTLELMEEGDEEPDTEALLASAWRYPMGTLRAEPVPGMPLHVEDIKTQTARGSGESIQATPRHCLA